MNEDAIIPDALEQLAVQAGIKGKWRPTKNQDGQVDLVVKGDKHAFFVEAKYEPRAYQLPELVKLARKHTPLIIIANYIVPDLRKQLRDHKINYLDRGGNFYLDIGPTMIWIEGQKPPPREKAMANRPFTKTGLRVVFYLLINPNDLNRPYRYLAAKTGTALGNVANVFKALTENGFLLPVDHQRVTWQNKKALLQRWLAGWGDTLKPALLRGKYTFLKNENFRNWGDLPIKGETVWGGEPAAENMTHYLTPGKLTLYTTQEKAYYIQQWKLIPDPNGHLEIYEKFWEGGIENFAPPLLVYADLLMTGDPRCLETAEMIYQQYLSDEFKQ
jgi:hypothetical protein